MLHLFERRFDGPNKAEEAEPAWCILL